MGGGREVIEYDLKITLSFVLAIATVVYTWWRTRDQNTDARFKGVDERFKTGSERMDRHDARLASMEQTLRGMPARQDMHELQIAITKLDGKLETMSAVMAGQSAISERMEAILSRHEDHLLKKS